MTSSNMTRHFASSSSPCGMQAKRERQFCLLDTIFDKDGMRVQLIGLIVPNHRQCSSVKREAGSHPCNMAPCTSYVQVSSNGFVQAVRNSGIKLLEIETMIVRLWHPKAWSFILLQAFTSSSFWILPAAAGSSMRPPVPGQRRHFACFSSRLLV